MNKYRLEHEEPVEVLSIDNTVVINRQVRIVKLASRASGNSIFVGVLITIAISYSMCVVRKIYRTCGPSMRM